MGKNRAFVPKIPGVAGAVSVGGAAGSGAVFCGHCCVLGTEGIGTTKRALHEFLFIPYMLVVNCWFSSFRFGDSVTQNTFGVRYQLRSIY